MAIKIIRVVFTRPNTTIEFPNVHFETQTLAGIASLRGLAQTNRSYLTGASELTCVVDHEFADASAFEANRTAIMALIPLWKTSSNSAAVDSYCGTNNIVTSILELDTAVDHSGFIEITNL